MSSSDAAMTLQLPRDSRFINFSSYRKSGVAVDTPVWFAECNGSLYLFSAGNAGKVKRLRNSSRSRVASCNAWGKLRGPWLPATARILTDPADRELAHTALRDKYGWQMRLGDWFAERNGRAAKRAYLAVELAATEAAATSGDAGTTDSTS